MVRASQTPCWLRRHLAMGGGGIGCRRWQPEGVTAWLAGLDGLELTEYHVKDARLWPAVAATCGGVLGLAGSRIGVSAGCSGSGRDTHSGG